MSPPAPFLPLNLRTPHEKHSTQYPDIEAPEMWAYLKFLAAGLVSVFVLAICAWLIGLSILGLAGLIAHRTGNTPPDEFRGHKHEQSLHAR